MFGNSPDETAYSRLALNKESVTEALTAIQPFLLSFRIGQGPQPELLDVSSIVPDAILLLDSYFYVVVFKGSSIAEWQRQGYQDREGHADFRELLQVFASPRSSDCCYVWAAVPVINALSAAQLQIHFFAMTLNCTSVSS